MRWNVLRLPALLLAALVILPAQAQEYSYDGNRWYEVEALVFRHMDSAVRVGEVPLASLPPAATRNPDVIPLRELASPLDAFLIDFAAQSPGSENPESSLPQPFGPEPDPGPAGDFRLMDFARDGWIALPEGLWGLARDHQRLQASPAHALLWHRAWRQPLLGPAQAPAVVVQEAEQPLAGSIRLLPFNAATLRVHVDLSVTLESGTWVLQEQRELLPDTFHYFDSPAFGLLLRVRAYVLPPRTAAASANDF